MRKMKRIVTLCMALAMAGAASAQMAKVVELDLDQAIAVALDENPTVKIAGMEIEKQNYAIKEARGGLLPELTASGGYTRNIISQKMGGSIKISGDNNFNASANLTLPLFAPGLYSMLKMSKEQMAQAVESARGSKLTLVNEVKKGFYNVLLAQQSLEVLLKSEENISATVANARTMYENGLVAEYDLISAEVQLSNLRPTILQTRMAIDVSKLLLKMYLGIDEDVDVVLKGKLDDYKAEMDARRGGFDHDLENNTELRSLDIQRNLLQRQLKLQQTQRMPTLAAVANITFSGTDMEPFAFGGAPARRDYIYNWQKPFYVGAQLSIPIFSGLSKLNAERQIKTSIRQMDMQRNYAEEGVRLQLNTAINNMITARETMLANEKTVSSAQKAYDIALTRYDAGAGTMLELNSAEVNLTQAQMNYTQSICDYMTAQADYEMILGKE